MTTTTSMPLANRGEGCRHHQVALVRIEGLEQVFLARCPSCKEGAVLRKDAPENVIPLFEETLAILTPEAYSEQLEEALWIV